MAKKKQDLKPDTVLKNYWSDNEQFADLFNAVLFDGRQVILLNGNDRGDAIRTPEASMAASAVSAIPAVRSFLLDMQKNIAKKNSVIMDGRDIGTVILPKAEVNPLCMRSFCLET